MPQQPQPVRVHRHTGKITNHLFVFCGPQFVGCGLLFCSCVTSILSAQIVYAGFVCARSVAGRSFSPRGGRSDRDRRFMADREVHGVSDEAHSMSLIMELPCDVRVTATNRDDWMEYCRRESPASVSGLGHHPLSFVLVVLNDYPAYGAEMEVRQHMARRERGDKELFGIVPTCVAPEHGICRPWQIGFRLSPD